jgi:ribbon-helix-helix CopG family protein
MTARRVLNVRRILSARHRWTSVITLDNVRTRTYIVPVRRYNFYLPDDLDRALDALKQRDGISESEAIRRALTEFLRRKRIPIRPRKGERTTGKKDQ